MKELEPHMIGIGPFIPHQETPLPTSPPGTLSQTLALLSVLRILSPTYFYRRLPPWPQFVTAAANAVF